MSIHRLLQFAVFDPEHIASMVKAYETVARKLTLANGESRASNDLIATTVIEIAQTGERDASILAEKTIARLHRSNEQGRALPGSRQDE